MRQLIRAVSAVLVLAISWQGGCGTYEPQTAAPVVEEGPFSDDQDPALAARRFIEDELLVQTLPGAPTAKVDGLLGEVGGTAVDRAAEIDLVVVKLDGTMGLEDAGLHLGDSDLVENVQKNYVFLPTESPDDPYLSSQTYLPRVRADEAWDVTTGAEEVVIAIVDTGVDYEHPDLADKVIGGTNLYDDEDDFFDEIGHGTSVAGVAAAVSDNAEGVAGLAWDNPIIVAKVVGEEGTSTGRHIAAAILWATGQGAKVINVSFAPLQSNSVVRSAAEYAYSRGSTVVISSGNSGKLYQATGYDAALFVGALGSTDRIASFSDRGPYVDLVAPGSAIRSTSPDAGYSLASGTSFSAPIVTGVAALVYSANPGMRPSVVQELLTSTAVDLGSKGEDDTFGYGLVDAAAAVGASVDVLGVEDEEPPTVRLRSPADGSTQTKRFRVSVTASDDEGVADVVLSVDGVAFATDSRSPYQFIIDPDDFQEGAHELSVVAADYAGNLSDPSQITATFGVTGGGGGVGQPSAIAFQSPAPGSIVEDEVTITTRVTDGDGLAAVEWLVDGEMAITNAISGTTTTVTFRWQAEDVPAGPHTITLVVTDSDGERTSAELTLIKD